MKDKTAHDESGYGVLIEQTIQQNQVILENMGEMLDLARRIPCIETRLDEHHLRFKIIEKAIKDTSKNLWQLDKNVAILSNQVHQLDTVVGNVEHKVEYVTTLVLTPYKKGKEFERRITKLEKAAS